MAVCRRTARIGRDAEFEELRSAYADVERGASRVVLLGGEAGSGKTRLIADFLDTVPDVPVISGNCVELSQAAVPFLPLASALRALAQGRDPEQMAALVSGAAGPLLQLLPRLQSDTLVAAGPDPLMLFEAVPELLDRLAPSGPAILIFEDLHWADASTLDLVRFLALSGLKSRLLVFTFRNDEMRRRHPLRPVLAELSRLPEVERIDIDPLQDDEVVELVNGLLPPGASRPPLHEIIRRADGNPFFVEELVTCCAFGAPALATHLGDVLLNRLDRMPEAAVAIAEVIAVTGRRASQQLIERVAGIDPQALHAGLRLALDDGAIVADPTGEYYGFRHALLQEAAYEGIPSGSRRALHQRIANALVDDPCLAEGGAQAAAGEIAFHAERGGDTDTAYLASIKAAQRAAESFAAVEAHRHFERAVDLHAHASPAVQMALTDLLEQASRAAQVIGNFARAVEHLRSAAEHADPSDVENLVRLQVKLGETLWFSGNSAEGVGVHEAALARLGDEPTGLRSEVLAFIALKAMLQERYEEAMAIGTEALAMARGHGSLPGQIRALEALGCTLTLTGTDVELGLDHLRESYTLAEEYGDTEYLVHAGVNLGASLEFAGRSREARAWDRHCVTTYAERGLVGAAVDFQRCNLAWGLIRVGEWDEAESLLQRLRFSQHLGMVRVHQQVCSATAAAARGRYEEAAAHIGIARADVERVGSLQFQAPLSWARMLVAEALGDEVELKASVEALWGYPAAAPVFPFYGELARILVDRMEATGATPEETVAMLDELDRRLAVAEGELGPAATGSAASYGRSRAWLAAERARALGEDQAAAWSHVLEADVDEPFVSEELYLQWRLAQAQVAAGADPEPLLVQTYERALALGAPIVDRVVALARRARIRLPGLGRDAASGVVDHGLTEREREVLELIAQGSTNRQIAEALFISAKTASVHVSNILAKLGVANRTEAAHVAHELGIGVSS